MRTCLTLLLMACTVEPVPVRQPADLPATAVAPAALSGLVGEPLTFDGSASTGAVEAVWTFGDGHTSPDLRATHAYSAPGHFTAVLQVTNGDGRSSTASLPVSITWPLVPEPPRTSATLALTSDGSRLVVVMPDFDTIALVDRATRTVVDHLHTCGHPRRLSLAPLDADIDLLAVSCEEGSPPGVQIWQLPRHGPPQIRGFHDSGADGRSPFGVIIVDDGHIVVTARQRADPDGHLLFLDNFGDLADAFTFGADLRGLASVGDQLLISRHRSPDEGGQLWRLGYDGQPVLTLLPPAPGPDSNTGARGVPNWLQPLAIRPDGRVAAIGGLRANIFRGLVRDGQALTDETTVRADLRIVSLHEGEGVTGEQIGSARLDNRDRVSALTWHPRGDWMYIAFAGNQRLDVLDSYTLGLAGSVGQIGQGADGLLAIGEQLWVDASLSRELVLLSIADPGNPTVDARIDLLPPTGEVLAPDILRGKQLFSDAGDPRMSLDGYVSCASCHLDGEDDGRTWDFTDRGEGLRNTISLRGMASRPGPIHWSANFDEVQDFEADIRGPQGGHGFLDDAHWLGPAGPSLGDPKAGLSADLDALAAYVTSLAPLDLPWNVDPPAVDEGRAAFLSADCERCHPDGATDSVWVGPGEPLLHNVGTLTPASGQRLRGPLAGLDTPSLHGLWATAPYFHDGSASTLADVLARSTGNHGDTSALTAEQLAALETWLRTL